jgi:hypothetical protein
MDLHSHEIGYLPLTLEVFNKMSEIDPKDFNWCKEGEQSNDPDPFKAADSYLKDKLRSLFER